MLSNRYSRIQTFSCLDYIP